MKIVGGGYIVVDPDGNEVLRKRKNHSNPNTIVGEYSYRHYTGAIAYEKFSENGILSLRIPMSTDGGCYAVVGNKLLFISEDKPETSTEFRTNSNNLVFESEKGDFEYNLVSDGTWYQINVVDYVNPEN